MCTKYFNLCIVFMCCVDFMFMLINCYFIVQFSQGFSGSFPNLRTAFYLWFKNCWLFVILTPCCSKVLTPDGWKVFYLWVNLAVFNFWRWERLTSDMLRIFTWNWGDKWCLWTNSNINWDLSAQTEAYAGKFNVEYSWYQNGSGCWCLLCEFSI